MKNSKYFYTFWSFSKPRTNSGCTVESSHIVSKVIAGSIGIYASRALLFLHSSTNCAHPSLCRHVLVLHEHCLKIVIFLSSRRQECRTVLQSPSTGGIFTILADTVLVIVQFGHKFRRNKLLLSSFDMKSLKCGFQPQDWEKLSMKKLFLVLSGRRRSYHQCTQLLFPEYVSKDYLNDRNKCTGVLYWIRWILAVGYSISLGRFCAGNYLYSTDNLCEHESIEKRPFQDIKGAVKSSPQIASKTGRM